MAYLRPTLPALIAQMLADLANYLGYTPLPTSNEQVIGTATAGLVDAQYGYIDYCYSQCTPFTSTGEYLAAWGALKGITRNAAVAASGTVAFTGTTGTTIASGTTLLGTNNQNYTTQASYLIGTTSTVAVTASQPGSAGNAPGGMALVMTTPIAGANASTSLVTAATGGADTETDSSLRTRILQRYAETPSGGNINDYIGWVEAVPGVTRAWAMGDYYPGPGSVTLWAMFDETESEFGGFPIGSNGGATQETRLPAATGDQLAIANYVYPLRPVTALVYVAAPIGQAVNVTITGTGGTPATYTATGPYYVGTWSTTPSAVQAGILAALQELFLSIGTATGGVIPVSEFYAAIQTVPAIGTFTLEYINGVAPANVTTETGYLPVIGVLAIS